MTPEELFTAALGLGRQWRVAECRFEGELFSSRRSLCEVIRNRVGSHSTDYLRHPRAGEHLRHSFEVFIRCLQGGHHNIFLLLMISFLMERTKFLRDQGVGSN
jgi:hypothetical protein